MMKKRAREAIRTDLFAHEAQHRKLDELGDPLQEIERHIDFAALAARVDESAPRPDGSKGGRPPYPTQTMVRILVLKRLYNLSDEQMEYQLLDRMSYKRFCGLENALRVPDRTTIWHFENWIGQTAAQALFSEMAGQLARKEFIARGGQIIDATLVRAPVQRNSRQDNDRIWQGDVPEDWSQARRRQKDVDASWTKKHGKSLFGYKLSVNVDSRYKLIRKMETDTASVHDSRHAKGLLDDGNTARMVYADKAYSSQALRTELGKRKLRDGIMRRAGKDRPLTWRDEQRSRRLSRTRSRVEHVFAGIERMGGQAGAHDRPCKGEFCDDDDGGLLQHQETGVSAKGRNQGLLRPERAQASIRQEHSPKSLAKFCLSFEHSPCQTTLIMLCANRLSG